MNSRTIFTGVLMAVFAAEVAGICVQHSQGVQLRDEERQYLSRLAGSSGTAASSPAEQAPPPNPSPASPVSGDLLRLRSEVTRLSQRKRELAGVVAQGERLRAELAARPTNSVSYAVPPQGFLSKSTARNVGYNSPEDTIQSALWAIQNRDITNLFQAFSPEMAQKLGKEFQDDLAANKDFFQGVDDIDNVGVLNREQLPDGSVRLTLLTGTNGHTENTVFRLVDGQWKIADPP